MEQEENKPEPFTPLTLRPAVATFAQAMEARLRQFNATKTGWSTDDIPIEALRGRLANNALKYTIRHDSESLIDTANFAMMLWTCENKTGDYK